MSSTLLCALLLTAIVTHAASRTTWLQTELNTYNSGLPSAVRKQKYDEMVLSPFAFYRGTNHIFWKDLGSSASLAQFAGTNTRIWLCGDAHANNMGSFTNDQGNLVFDLNDFDESVLADYQLDVWRFATSIKLLMRDNGGFSSSDIDFALDSFTEFYLDDIETYKTNNAEISKMFTSSNTYGLLNNFLANVQTGRSRKKLLDKYAPVSLTTNKRALDISGANIDLAAVTSTEYSALVAQMGSVYYGSTLSGGISYSSSYFTIKSIAQRLNAGVGSLGNKRYYVHIEGPTTGQDDDVILDVKAQTNPSPYLNSDSRVVTTTNAASASHHGKRVVVGAKSLGYRVDDYLGYITLSTVHYSVRERNPYKDSFDLTTLTTLTQVSNMAEQYGQVLAAAHSRADWDATSSSVAYDFDSAVFAKINGKHTEFRSLVRSIANSYAQQVLDDYNSFVTIKSSLL